MMSTLAVRLIVAGAIFVFACTGRALAAAGPDCPAFIGDSYAFAAPNAGLTSLSLGADSARTVSGDILAHTNAGWFSFSFPPTVIQKGHLTTQRGDVLTVYRSNALYARFPANVYSIDHWWVSAASSSADGKEGRNVPCLPRHSWSAAVVQSPPPLSAPPVAEDPIILATPIPAPWAIDCASPDHLSTAVKPVQPDYPESAMSLNLGYVSVQILVTIEPSGSIAHAEIYKSSNNMAIDAAALQAARASTYAPGMVLCKPTYGSYIFKADFRSGL